MKKGIAFFDFDGTITTRDTLLEFIRFSKGTLGFGWGFSLNSPYIAAYKIGLISNQDAKERILRFFFKDTPVDAFREQCRLFSQQCLPRLLRPKAMEEIKRLQQQGTEVVVVSASPENWIQHWADSVGVKLIASTLEVKNGRLTGRIAGKNCHGDEKVRRILEKHVMADYEEIYAYGDTRGDLPMLGLATTSFYRPFRK